jgi:hypothetical protein
MKSEVFRVAGKLVLPALHPIGLEKAFGSREDLGYNGRAPHDAKRGAVAQLGERLICIQEVAGSIPTSSTSITDISRACSSGG